MPLDESFKLVDFMRNKMRCQHGTAYRWESVKLDGDDLTSDENDLVLTSFLKEGRLRNASNVPFGGCGPS